MTTPCDIVVADDTDILPLLRDIDVLVTMALTAEMSRAVKRLDVWYRYPREPGRAAPAVRPFHKLSNVLMIPHIAGWTEGMLKARARLIAENIRRIACGETPLNLVC